MNRSGNIGAAKDMDSVFANFTDEEIEQDLIFDEDDQLIEIVEGYTEDGETVFEEDQEIFNIMHQVMDDDKTPEQVKKDTEDLLGPDNRNDQKINDIEDVKKEKIDDDQTIDSLKKNGESEADKELGLDKLEDEYHSSATVEEAYKAFFGEEAYDYDAEDEAEGSDTKFGNKELDNTQMPADDIKPTEDENYNSTNDATVKEEYDYDKPDEAEGTDDKFGPKIDNTQMPADDIAPTGDEEYNSTNDATVKEDAALEEAFDRWLHEETEQDDAKCECGKPDCPICGKKGDLAPDSAPVEDKTDEGRHEESAGENITDADGEGLAPGQLDDNSFPLDDEMTPDCSPESDNGDITDDGESCDNGEKKEAETPAPVADSEAEKIEEAFEAWLHENDLEIPILEPNDTIMPEDIEKAEDELEKNAPGSGEGIDEAVLLEKKDPERKALADKFVASLKEFLFDEGITRFYAKARGLFAFNGKFLKNKTNECLITINEKKTNTTHYDFRDGGGLVMSSTSDGTTINDITKAIAKNKEALKKKFEEDTGYKISSITFKNEELTADLRLSVIIGDKISDSVDEAFEAWLHEEDEPKAEGTTDNMPESDATIPEDEACGKGSGVADTGANDASVDEAFEAWLHEEDDGTTDDSSDDEPSDAPVDDSKDLNEAFESWLHEEEEVAEDLPDKSDVADAAEVEADDTKGELDDDLAMVADDDSEAGGDAGLTYDPSDEELLDLIGGDDD